MVLTQNLFAPQESIETLTIEEAVALLSSKNVSRSGRKGSRKEAEATSIDQPKASNGVATKAKGRQPSSKKPASGAATGIEKVKEKASQEKKKNARGPKETKSAKPAADAKESEPDKLAGDAKAKPEIRSESPETLEQGKENGTGGVKRGRGRPRRIPISPEGATLAVVHFSILRDPMLLTVWIVSRKRPSSSMRQN
jgi:hypothetical protein